MKRLVLVTMVLLLVACPLYACNVVGAGFSYGSYYSPVAYGFALPHIPTYSYCPPPVSYVMPPQVSYVQPQVQAPLPQVTYAAPAPVQQELQQTFAAPAPVYAAPAPVYGAVGVPVYGASYIRSRGVHYGSYGGAVAVAVPRRSHHFRQRSVFISGRSQTQAVAVVGGRHGFVEARVAPRRTVTRTRTVTKTSRR